MKNSILGLLVCLINAAGFGQTSNDSERRNPYIKYDQCCFESGNHYKLLCKFENDSPPEKHKLSSFLSCTLKSDSTYTITMEIDSVNSEYELEERHYKFSGCFKEESDGRLILLGHHPFTSNYIDLWIDKPKHTEECYYFTGFSFKFNRQFQWIRKSKTSTYCDGGCEYCLFEW